MDDKRLIEIMTSLTGYRFPKVDGGKMRAAPSNMDLNMLEAFDCKYKAQKGVWRNKDKLVNE